MPERSANLLRLLLLPQLDVDEVAQGRCAPCLSLRVIDLVLVGLDALLTALVVSVTSNALALALGLDFSFIAREFDTLDASLLLNPDALLTYLLLFTTNALALAIRLASCLLLLKLDALFVNPLLTIHINTRTPALRTRAAAALAAARLPCTSNVSKQPALGITEGDTSLGILRDVLCLDGILLWLLGVVPLSTVVLFARALLAVLAVGLVVVLLCAAVGLLLFALFTIAALVVIVIAASAIMVRRA
ncbi:hypothetical protein EJ03DRAFT_123503 [Teratosphaeria nubilosa]|uniref:Uncharacterized protein n=1 Tax=Teratosphaeria nubilosa TaxID=161662 RepID=A0A6G1L5Y6_9PEZI|nr:hypothetical protein EJ03DRAFT_123503 [Teratosphaeria nubilosa]